MNAMFRKELRDAVRWLPVGTILLTVMLCYGLRQQGFYQNLAGQLYFFAWICSALFGFLLSLLTFLPEERDAARAFLVHRSISLDRIFRTRVAVGLLVYGVSMMLPLVCVAIYLANIGPMYAPVSPLQVFPASVAVVFCAGFYFAGIIVSCRPSYWLGTRLVPIVGAFATAIMTVPAMMTAGMHRNIEEYYRLVQGSTLLIGMMGLAVLAVASRHAFQRLPSSIAPASATIRSNALLLTLLVSCLVLFPVLTLFIASSFQVAQSEILELRCTKSGEPWITTRSYTDIRVGSKSLARKVHMTNSENAPEENSDNAPTNALTYMFPLTIQLVGWDTQTAGSLQQRKKRIFFDRWGYLLVYDFVGMANGERMILTNIVGADRITIPSQPRGLPFRSRPRLFAASQIYELQDGGLAIPNRFEEEMKATSVINSEGVFRIDWKTGQVVHQIKQELISYAELYESSTIDDQTILRNYVLLVRSGQNVTVFRRKTSEPREASIDLTSDFVLDGSFSLPTSGNQKDYIYYKDSAIWTYIRPNHPVVATQYKVVRSVDSTVDTYDFQTPSEIIEATSSSNHWAIPLFIGTSPSVVLIGFFAFAGWMIDGTIHNIHFVMLLIQTLVSALLAYIAARHRRLSKSQRWWWAITGFLLGIGTSLAIIAIYPRVYFVACASCNRRRRVEQEACEHCGVQWDPAIEEGIEVFERQTLHNNATHPLVTQ